MMTGPSQTAVSARPRLAVSRTAVVKIVLRLLNIASFSRLEIGLLCYSKSTAALHFLSSPLLDTLLDPREKTITKWNAFSLPP
jgi:hypothetical protein